MKRLKLVHVATGQVLGEILETVTVNGHPEFVVQSRQGRLFVRQSVNVSVK